MRSAVLARTNPFKGLALLATVVLLSVSCSALAVDAEAAQALAKKNDCFKCHNVDKNKKGPSFKKTAAKYSGQAEGAEKILRHLTTGPKVKLSDGSEEDHKIIDSKDLQSVKNLVDWILSQESSAGHQDSGVAR